MSPASIVLVLSTVFGGLSAVLWWWAATINPRIVPSRNTATSDDGDFAFEIEGGQTLVWRIALQGRLNAGAAACAGIAVLLQALLSWLPRG